MVDFKKYVEGARKLSDYHWSVAEETARVTLRKLGRSEEEIEAKLTEARKLLRYGPGEEVKHV